MVHIIFVETRKPSISNLKHRIVVLFIQFLKSQRKVQTEWETRKMAAYCATASSIKFPNFLLPRKQWLQLHTHQHRYDHYSSQLQLQLSGTGTGTGRSRTTHHNHKCFSQKQKKTESESTTQQEENEESEFERLFSNLNQATLKREPGFFSINVTKFQCTPLLYCHYYYCSLLLFCHTHTFSLACWA